MNNLKKMLVALTSQIKSSDVTLATAEIPHKIKDDNQSIHNGVINEEFNSNLRSASTTSGWRKRSAKPIGHDGGESDNVGRTRGRRRAKVQLPT